eukprot:Rhum_TRINITY_DN8591_c1_g1::Rhum_TRINITY_DN8591_c1_g1_i1::g.28889::m.28889
MAADAPHPLDHAIRFFDKADGRDKLYKTLQNWSKVMAWRYTVLALTAPTPERKAARESAAMYRKVAESLSSFRSLQKFFKWIKTAKEVHVALAAPADMSAGDVVETVSSVLDIGYKASDNVEFLCKVKALAGSPKEWEQRSKSFQFWAYFFAVCFDALLLARCKVPTPKEESLSADEKGRAMALRRNKLLLDFAKDLADFLRVASSKGYLTSVPAPARPAFAGMLGVVSGGIGTYQVWQKCA